ncbi:ClpP/crotonase-like domain-containing protein [Syncephalis fuscata]|nr:ClpP/crotonase-like domain-containing protein [Syncephalis fuscata]
MTVLPNIPQSDTLQIRLIALNTPEDGPDADYGYLAVITFDRPNRANALSPEAYVSWRDAMAWAAETDAVRAVILTGNGRFYCSGQELTGSFASTPDFEADLRRRVGVTENLVDIFIDFPKLLVAAVNGPAYGFGVTHLAICDTVYATKEATFKTPFMELGFCAEGCSSYLFPKIMGTSRANEMILMGRQFTAEEMVNSHYISQILPSEDFLQRVIDITIPAARFPTMAVRQSKELVMSKAERTFLHEINKREMTLLIERMLSKECHDAIANFLISQQKRRKQPANMQRPKL